MRLRTLTLALTALAATATADTFGAGGTAAPWLKLAPSARVAALGEAGSALGQDVDLAALNPASLSTLKGQQVTLMHNAYVQDSAVEHLAYGLGVMNGAGLSVSADYLSFGSVDTYKVVSNALVKDSSVNPSALSAALSYGQAIGAFSAGLSLKYVSQSLDGSSSSMAFGGDLGLRYAQQNSGFHYGLAGALLNLGTTLDSAPLPQTLKLGANGGFDLSNGSKLDLSWDVNFPSADKEATNGSLGLEYTAAQYYAVRGGYKMAGNGGVGGFSVGACLRYSVVNLDYAFVNRDFLGAANQISLGAKF